MEELTNVTAEFAKKHVDTRWLSVKLACVRVLEQWDNLCEYFLTFLPTQKKIFSEKYYLLCDTKESKQLWRTQRLKLTFHFVHFVAQDSENFLQAFQANEPMILMLYPKICKLLTNLMSIRKNILSQNSQENVGIDVLKVENHKSKKIVEIGVKTRHILGDPNLVSSENQGAFRKSCLKFYSIATKYLQEHLPLNLSVIRHVLITLVHNEKVFLDSKQLCKTISYFFQEALRL